MAITFDEALQTTITIISEEFELDPKTLNANSQLSDDLELDSLDTIAVISRINYELKIQLSEEDLTQINNLGDLAKAIVAKQDKKPEE